jgi:hypothetical protein
LLICFLGVLVVLYGKYDGLEFERVRVEHFHKIPTDAQYVFAKFALQSCFMRFCSFYSKNTNGILKVIFTAKFNYFVVWLKLSCYRITFALFWGVLIFRAFHTENTYKLRYKRDIRKHLSKGISGKAHPSQSDLY